MITVTILETESDRMIGDARVEFIIPDNPEFWEVYRDEAAAIIDEASRELNPVGLSSLVGAICQRLSEQYYGKHNKLWRESSSG